MKTIYDLKFLVAVLLGTLVVATISIISYLRGSILFCILFAAVAVWGFVTVVGHLLSPVYLQRAIIRLLKRYGGKLEYDRLKEYFMASAGVPSARTDDVNDLLPYLLSKLEKRRLIQTINGVIELEG